ncbi:hypothetical protein [Ruegeria sp. HKCCA5929]|nr:hypothetical protein [Ruegeria sp. HKCCA5929]
MTKHIEQMADWMMWYCIQEGQGAKADIEKKAFRNPKLNEAE